MDGRLELEDTLPEIQEDDYFEAEEDLLQKRRLHLK